MTPKCSNPLKKSSKQVENIQMTKVPEKYEAPEEQDIPNELDPRVIEFESQMTLKLVYKSSIPYQSFT